MAEPLSDPITPRARPRIPSGPRPQRESQSSFRSTSSSSVPQAGSSRPSLRDQTSLSSFARLRELNDSPLDALIDTEHEYTLSPEHSPKLYVESPPLTSSSVLPSGRSGSPVKSPTRAGTFAILQGKFHDATHRSHTAPLRPATPSSFSIISRPTTPIQSPPGKQRPKPSKLNTLNLAAPTSSPTKPVSPGLKHWQQVRTHVMAPTPAEEKSSRNKKLNIVSKAAGRFGFRHAAENVMGYEERRRSTMGFVPDLGGLSVEEQEEIARERRKFARDVKACLDACAAEESQRRLQRAGGIGKDPSLHRDPRSQTTAHKSSGATSVHTSSHLLAQKYTFDPNFSSFAPLLTELHRHLPAARAKKLWSRTCPHHAAILAELGVSFLPDGASTDGERQQALEVFGVVVRSWASDSAEEELDRWLWLCRALLIPDRQLRKRGLALLTSFLQADPALPPGHDRPHTATAFQSLAIALITLLHALEIGGYGADDQSSQVWALLEDLTDGNLIDIEPMTLKEILGSDVVEMTEGGSSGLDKDLLWMAVGRLIGQGRTQAKWLLDDEGEVLSRFLPPPLLHATPPIILRLRSLSTSVHLASLSHLVRTSDDKRVLQQAWQVAERFLIPDATYLPDPGDTTAVHLGAFLLNVELASLSEGLTSNGTSDPNDPFRITMSPSTAQAKLRYRKALMDLLQQETGKKGIEAASEAIVSSGPLMPITSMIKTFLESRPFTLLGKQCANTLFARLASAAEALHQAKPFLTHLQSSHPQLLYRPLFSLSASTNVATLPNHLRLVRTLSSILGPSVFWTAVDPQMVVIVLMGDVAPPKNKGKGKEGETAQVNVKLGRYAVLIEFISVLEEVGKVHRKDKSLKAFLEAVESRLGVMLEAEEKKGALPSWYQALICRLFFKIRSISLSIKKASWQRLILSWVTNPVTSRGNAEDGPNQILRSAYTTLSNIHRQTKGDPVSESKLTTTTRRVTMGSSPPIKEENLLKLRLTETASSLLVAIHTCLTADEWQALLPHLWVRCGQTGKAAQAIVFLFMKCSDIIPHHVHELIISDFYSESAFDRSSALRKLANLYGWRHQVLSQLILTDRRGPIFHFTARTLEFVATEIGTPNWVPSHDIQDAALQRYGTTLPLELRQRLMELGWSEDQSLAGKSDWEQIPLSRLPGLHFQDNAENNTGGNGVHSAPTRSQSLIRRGSSGSGSSFHGKKRRAIFAPIFLSMVNEQATILAYDSDSIVGTTSRDLLRMLQRDDASAFLRPFTDDLSLDFTQALARLNAVVTFLTPSFAYAAFNALVGYLKTVLRTDPSFGIYAPALATIAYLVPYVSEMSLRDIRKNKAEHVLLPASIHEEEGGFKVHAPWRDGSLDVQTAQLLILNEILKANPREVYLVKKMLSNLQIQASTTHLPFARAWLILIASLFSTVNRNYNDRAELRHFLSNVATIFRLHGARDQLVASHSMRIFILCSARFRRLFASMGFSTVMRSVYEVYAASGTNAALKDCIEYSVRSFYRIHQDSFVYQACTVIVESDFDAKATYDLLACLSQGNSDLAGVASGLKGMNDKEEVEALVQMISGPELTLSEIGTGAAERQASKMATINLDDSIFPKENIIKLFVTVIAANPTTKRAADFLRLFTGMVPSVKDQSSVSLLREGIEALGSVIVKGKMGDETAMQMFHPGTDDSKSDWTSARREYVFLVEKYALSGGQLSSAAMKRTLEMVYELLRKQPEAVGPAAASILKELAKTHLSATGTKPLSFLRDIAPLFRMFISVVDFSGLIDEITALVIKSGYELDQDTTLVIIDGYVSPSVRMLASASEDNMAFIVPIRSSIVELLASAVFLRGDALGALELCPPNHNLLAGLVIPLCLSLSLPREAEREQVFDALWIRILNYIIKPPSHPRNPRQARALAPTALAATAILTLQIIKLICIRASDGISKVTGLWHYISRYLTNLVNGGSARFIDGPETLTGPRILDWVMWSTYELLSLHRFPLMIEMRYLIQIQLSHIIHDANRSHPSTPGEAPRQRMPSSPHIGGRARMPSARTPSVAFLRSFPGGSSSPEPGLTSGHARQLSSSRLTPDSGGKGGGHSRMPSQHLTPYLGHGRMPSGSGMANAGGLSLSRPSFADLSARRASRPAFAIPGGGLANYRFPSSQPVRSLNTDKGGGGAIIHLLGAPNNVLSATSTAIPSLDPRMRINDVESSKGALRELKITSEDLKAGTKRAVRSCQVIFGYPTEDEQGEDEDDNVRMWSDHDAIQAISEQTRLFIEEEFRDIFVPAQSDWASLRASQIESEKEGYSLERLEKTYGNESDDEKDTTGGREDFSLPKLEISSPTR